MRTLLRTILLLIAVYIFVPASSANACSRIGPFSFKELFAGDVIVRATAVKYVVEPHATLRTTGVPDSTVEFKIEETLKGAGVPEKIALNGYLSSEDDFNEMPVPYKFVRPGGRGGSCFANTYKQGAQFLLFLKKTESGYTPNISALGPVNEQLRSETDPWLLWVKVRLNPCDKLHAGDKFDEMINEGKEEKEREERRAFIYSVMQDKRSRSIQYRVAKCYLQKYEAKDGPEDQYIKYIKRWVEAYEKLEEK